MRARIERVTKIDGTLDKLTTLLQEALKELDAKKKASKSVKALHEAVDSQRDKHVELEGLKKVPPRCLFSPNTMGHQLLQEK